MFSPQEVEPFPEPQFDDHNAAQGLAGTDIIFRPIDLELLRVYFSYFISSGFLAN